MKIIHSETGMQIGQNLKPAITFFWPRLIGFIFRKSPKPYDGIYFPKCNWVHNSFVRFPIDVVFIQAYGLIVGIIRGFRPWSFSRVYFKAQHTIEFAIGVLPVTVKIGDHLDVVPS